jgi:hypothetical protein
MKQKDIEDIYPLSPLQHGLLFHTLYASGSGVYVEQFLCHVHGILDVAAFGNSFRKVIDRHPALRTAYRWNDLDRPLQVVYKHVELPFEEHDWRTTPPEAQEERLAGYLRADRERGFMPSRPPLSRLALFRRADDAYDVVWSCHHMVMDGWSMPIVLKEVLEFYDAETYRRELRLPPCPPYRNYIAWLQAQDSTAAEAFWRRTLAGFETPTPLAIDAARSGEVEPSSPVSFGEHELRLTPEATARLNQFVRRHRLTLNTLIQGAWSALLSRYSERSDVVFGVTVSGRPTSLARVETIVGLFINTLPLRITVPGSALVIPWLHDVQARLVELRQFEFSSLVQVQQWSDVPRGRPLFESIVVFENYPLDATLFSRSGGLGVEPVRILEQTNYPLTLVALPGTELLLRLGYDAHRFDATAIRRLLGHLRTLLEGLGAGTDRRLEDLPMLTAVEHEQLVQLAEGSFDEASAIAAEDAGRLLDEVDRFSDAELDSLLGSLLFDSKEVGDEPYRERNLPAEHDTEACPTGTPAS